MPLSSVVGAQSIIKPGVCTSSTRPAVPFEGQMIYETDTDKVLVWNGTAWYPNWNTAWGLVASGSATSNSSITTTEAVQVTASTFTAVASRYYKITYYEPIITPAAGAGNYITLNIRLTNASGTVYTSGQSQATGATAGSAIGNLVTIQTFSAGSVVLVGSAIVNTGSGACYRGATAPARILVEDIGPA